MHRIGRCFHLLALLREPLWTDAGYTRARILSLITPRSGLSVCKNAAEAVPNFDRRVGENRNEESFGKGAKPRSPAVSG
jgi:hypothetical protein